MTIKSVLEKWLNEVKDHEFPSYDSIPGLDLYMSQMLSIMDEFLTLFENTINDKLITKPMINNYVKDGILPKPTKKKYSKEQVVRLFQISLLKNVINLNEIHTLLDEHFCNKTTEQAYDEFNKMFSHATDEFFSHIISLSNDIEDGDYPSYLQLALKLSIWGFSNIVAAKKIIYLVKQFKGISSIQKEINKEE